MLKQTLLILGVLSASGAALAATELTNPFYVPDQDRLASTTSLSTGRTQWKNGLNAVGYDTTVSEELAYGAGRGIAVVGSVENVWFKDKNKVTGVSDKDDTNIGFTVGALYNVLDNGPAKVQLGALYGQSELDSKGNDGAYKYADFQVKTGYDMGTFLPYVTAGVETPLFQSSAGMNDPIYRFRTALYTNVCDNDRLAFDAGVQFTFDDNVAARIWSVDAELSYFFAPKWAVSLYGDYVFSGEARGNADLYASSVGLRLRTSF